MGRWADGRTGRWADKWIDGQTGRRKGEQMDGRTRRPAAVAATMATATTVLHLNVLLATTPHPKWWGPYWDGVERGQPRSCNIWEPQLPDLESGGRAAAVAAWPLGRSSGSEAHTACHAAGAVDWQLQRGQLRCGVGGDSSCGGCKATGGSVVAPRAAARAAASACRRAGVSRGLGETTWQRVEEAIAFSSKNCIFKFN